MRRKFNVEIGATAERDVRAIYDYIAVDDPTAAGRWVAALRAQIARLESHPHRGAVIAESADLGLEYRHLVHGRYRTIYRIEDGRVLVVRVIHAAQLLEAPE